MEQNINVQILREAWEGEVPCRFSLNVRDLANRETPPAFFCLLHRTSYFPMIYSKLVEHFESYISATCTENEIWISYERTALKWNYPVGGLIDQLYGTEKVLPIYLEVNFGRYPPELIKYEGPKSIRINFAYSLKESSALMIGSAKPVMDMTKEQEDELWMSGLRGDVIKYLENSPFLSYTDPAAIRYLPVRFLSNNTTIWRTKPLTPVKQDNELMTLADAIRMLPNEYQGENVVIQGVSIPLNTPMHYLWLTLRHPDNFLYVVIRF